MVKKIITEISEEDFRKLDLSIYKTERVETASGYKFVMKEKKINDILDEEIRYALESGYESDLKDLDIPVTIAIHETYTEEDYKKCREMFKGMDEEGIKNKLLSEFSYLDKYMNNYTGSQTFQLGWGIKHLYSTRDYYEAHEDYWRVRKDETKVIYRIKLSDEWKNKFVLKHKTESVDWPYNELPEGVSPDFISGKLVTHLDLIDGEYKVTGYTGEFEYKYSSHVVPIDIKDYE